MGTTEILETPRLHLRAYTETDIPELPPLIGAREVVATALRIPHPYSEADARRFVASIQNDDEIRLGIRLRSDGRLVGGVGLRLSPQQKNAELGYWIGAPHSGKGYATEVAQEMLRHGFRDARLHRFSALHFKDNVASARVLRKPGMRYEGCQREHVCKWGQFIDSELFGVLRSEWEGRK